MSAFTPSILIVDDSSATLSAIKNLLKDFTTLDIETATSGKEAVFKSNARRYCVVLVDMNMPEMDGFETTKRIHETTLNKKTPVIIISAQTVDNNLLKDIYAAGAIDFFSKPIHPEALTSKINLFVDLDRQRHELQELSAKADLASQAKSLFLANMSHEMRTPLNGVIGTTELLHKTFLSEAQSRYVNVIRSSGEALLSIISDVLDFSKIEAGHLHLDTSPTHLRTLVHETLYPQILRASEQGTDLAFEISPTLPDELVLDPLRIRQILTNLVSNAIKFTKNGSITLTFSKTDTTLVMNVADTGIGIPADRLDYIFGNFTQADLTTTKKYGGTGLGLAICRQLARMMGGDISVRSVVGEGSCFTLTLPLTQTTQAAQSPAIEQLKDKNIIICDPSKLYQNLMTRQLSEQGLKVSCFARCEDVLEYLKSIDEAARAQHILLIDEKCGPLSVDDLTVILKADPRFETLPIYLTAGYGTERRLDRLQQIGYEGCMLKPYDATDLIHTLTQTSHSGAATQTAIVDTPDLYGYRVLLVEDDMVNRMIAEEMLRDLGVNVTLAANGAEALEIMTNDSFDLVLMDCMMPVMDGYEATKQIRATLKSAKSTPILAMTANALEGDREKCLAAGMTDYLTKPIRSDVLRRALETHLKN